MGMGFSFSLMGMGFSSSAFNVFSSLGFSFSLMGTGFSSSAFNVFSSLGFSFSLMGTGFSSSAFNVPVLAFEPLFLHTLWNSFLDKWLFLFFPFLMGFLHHVPFVASYVIPFLYILLSDFIFLFIFFGSCALF